MKIFKDQKIYSIFVLCKPFYKMGILSIFLTFLNSGLEIFSTYLVIPLIQILGNSQSSINLQDANFLDRVRYFYSYVPERYQILAILIVLLLITIIKNIFAYLAHIYINDFTLRCGNQLREKCVERFLGLEINFYNKTSVGTLLSYVNEQAQRSERLFSSYLEIIREIVLITALVAFLIFLSPSLTLVTVLSLTIVVISIKLVVKEIQTYGLKSARAIEGFSSLITEMISGIRVIKSFHTESRELNRAKEALRERYSAELTAYKFLSAVAPLTETSGIFILLIIIASGVYFLSPDHNISLAVLLTYTLALLRTLPRVSQISKLRSNISLLMASFEEIKNFFLNTESNLEKHEFSKITYKNNLYIYKGIKRDIEFRNVVFAYPDSKDITLNNVNLKIKKGSTVALVGSSGSGKSTLADLIIGFYEPNQGEILIDGVNLRQLNLGSWRRKIAMVSQDTFLFNASIRDNITYGHPDATEIELFDVAKKAYAFEFIQNLPQEFNTAVGNRGTKLSGGQRQRIAIARAILCDPDILILDEATSALDSQSERMVQKAIEQVSQRRTVIMIAHRLSTIEKADMIVVLSQGHIVEKGNHEELLELKGNYYSLYQSQT